MTGLGSHLLLAAFLLNGNVTSDAAGACNRIDQLAGGCASVDAGTDGRQVDLVGEATSGGGEDAPDGGSAPLSDEDDTAAEPGEPLRWDWTIENPPDVTLADLASFVPSAGAPVAEPAGWGIVGLETNFYADTPAQVLDGELLEQPASVRFTPVAWHWSYGDGAVASVSAAGERWANPAAEFEPTPASHRYNTAGTYDVELAVEFAAEFRFAGGIWLPVDGTVVADAGALSVRIGTADTLLVERGCDAASGPGC